MKFSPPRGARAITPFLLSILALPAVAIAGTQEQLRKQRQDGPAGAPSGFWTACLVHLPVPPLLPTRH